MNTFCIASLVGVLSMGTAYAGGDPFIDFNAPGLGFLTDITTQYAAEGVTFSGVAWGGGAVTLQTFNNSYFSDVNALAPSPNVLSDYYGGSPYTRAQTIQINFTSPASDVSFEYNPAGYLGADTVFDVYNTSDVLVDSFSDPNATGDNGNWYLETIPGSDVGQVDIVAPTEGWGHYVDNLQFTESASAPDGGMTLGLLGTAFAAMAGLRKKLS